MCTCVIASDERQEKARADMAHHLEPAWLILADLGHILAHLAQRTPKSCT